MVCMLEAVTVKEEVLKQNEVLTDRINHGQARLPCTKILGQKPK